MNAPNDNSAARRLIRWWLTPPRPGLQNFIHPWEYRRIRYFGIVRIVGGIVAAVAGIICLSYSAWGWAAFFLVVGVLDVAAGLWFLTIDRSAPARA